MPNDHHSEIFSGWKEIANYLGKGVRTVQRYERELHFPIHRPAGQSKVAVFATRAELDKWVKTSAMRVDPKPRRRVAEETNRVGAKFLLIDSETALTFSNIALGTRDPEKKRRSIETARKAYTTILRLKKNIEMSDAEGKKLETNLERLRSELRSLKS